MHDETIHTITIAWVFHIKQQPRFGLKIVHNLKVDHCNSCNENIFISSIGIIVLALVPRKYSNIQREKDAKLKENN